MKLTIPAELTDELHHRIFKDGYDYLGGVKVILRYEDPSGQKRPYQFLRKRLVHLGLKLEKHGFVGFVRDTLNVEKQTVRARVAVHRLNDIYREFAKNNVRMMADHAV